jgi:alkanesulfonate monooxygenase SsuD/methylene tetrahydromethanopterin reductase-like flavin-dependent oxidoreductase (luciferase family)
MKLRPMQVGDAERDEVLSRVTRRHSEETWIYGTPEQVADKLRPYVDAGATWLHLADTLPFVIDVGDGQHSVARTIEVARLLKAADPSSPGDRAVASASG